jgi:hypothetical protein
VKGLPSSETSNKFRMMERRPLNRIKCATEGFEAQMLWLSVDPSTRKDDWFCWIDVSMERSKPL